MPQALTFSQASSSYDCVVYLDNHFKFTLRLDLTSVTLVFCEITLIEYHL